MSEAPKMQWRAGSGKFFYSLNGCYFVRLEDGTYIEVRPEVYNERFNEYLERLGVKRTSWYEIMQRAEQEWQDYCSLIDNFAANSQQWLDKQGYGVFVEPGKREQKRSENRE